jgi:cytochrome c-type biogenesis protein
VDAPFGLALAAGMLATVNPCGFALLPAYLSMLVLGEPGGGPDGAPAGRLAPIGRALALTGAMTVGFVAVFGAFGLLAAPAADALARQLPWVSVLIGVALIGLGGWLLAGRELPVFTPKIAAGPALRLQFGPMVLFGAAYAIASLGCTVGPFLAVVVANFQAGSVAAGVGLFLAYAAGMALVVGAAALTVALARESAVRRARRAAPAVARISGALLVLTGVYVAWYGWYELRVFAGGTGRDPVVGGAARVQSAISTWLSELGPEVVAATVAALLVAAVAIAFVRGRPGGPTRNRRRT